MRAQPGAGGEAATQAGERLADAQAPVPEPEPDAAARVRVVLDPELVDSLVRATETASFAALREQLETRARRIEGGLRRTLPAPVVAALDDLLTGEPSRRSAMMLAQIAGLGIALALIASLVRGRGDVVVCIEYPAELRGSFSVRLARRPAGGPQGARIVNPAAALRAKRRVGASSRREHPMVSRETQFRGVPARRYWIGIDGFIQVAHGDQILGTHVEEQAVHARRGQSVRVEFDLHPRDYPLDVTFQWDQRPVSEALVALYGAPGSARFTRGTPVRFAVARGRHTVVVGSNDRVCEVEVDVESYQPTTVLVELGDREHALFTGCPPAVEPYLQGDVPAAARALERDGQHHVSHVLMARFHRERDQFEAAARHYEEAGRPVEAADLYQSLSQFERAAELYDEAGQAADAAEAFRSAGDLSRAGEAFERAEQFESAVECFRAAGDVDRFIEALEKQGAYYEAAEAAIERANWGRAIRNLQQVKENDPHFLDASRRLVDAYQREGHSDLAARKLEEIVEAEGENVSNELFDRLARLHEEACNFDRAAEVLERVRERDATFAHLSTRIEGLRKRSRSGAAPTSEAYGEGSRYDVLEEVGRGGMGVVYRARDRRLGRVVALKRLTESLRDHPKAVDLFLREARAAAALNHPNIVTLHDAGQENGSYFITMELLEGYPLRALVRRRGKLSPRDVARLGVQIASALGYAHDQGIVHRDIKTANLFFTKGRVVKVMDFGLAKMMEEVRRATTMIGGTPYYMAPEQGLGKTVDGRADLYALGVTFFELLTGSVPFTEGDVAFQHRHTPPPDPREQGRDVPEALAELVLQMMAKTPGERPANAEQVGERLQAIIRGAG